MYPILFVIILHLHLAFCLGYGMTYFLILQDLLITVDRLIGMRYRFMILYRSAQLRVGEILIDLVPLCLSCTDIRTQVFHFLFFTGVLWGLRHRAGRQRCT